MNPSENPPHDLDAQLHSMLAQHTSATQKRRRMPYYTLRHGQNIIKVIEALASHPETPQKISVAGVQPKTVRSQFYQACNYIKDHLDQDKRYAAIIDNLTTHIEKGCIVIRSKGGALIKAGQAINYRMNLEAFIEVSQPGDKFPVEPPIVLSDEEVLELLNCLCGLEELFLYRISRAELEVIRV